MRSWVHPRWAFQDDEPIRYQQSRHEDSKRRLLSAVRRAAGLPEAPREKRVRAGPQTRPLADAGAEGEVASPTAAAAAGVRIDFVDKFCGECGEDLKPGEPRCPACGALVAAPAAFTAPVLPERADIRQQSRGSVAYYDFLLMCVVVNRMMIIAV